MNIYLDSIVISMGDNGMEISRMLDYQMRTLAPNDYYYYAEWGVRTADFVANGSESFVTSKSDIVIQGGWDPKKPGELLKAISSNIYSSDNSIKVICKENNNLQIKELLGANDKIGSAFCLPNTDNDTTQISYTGKHYFTYSDPKILAVLASPPYFKDLDNDELSGQMVESTTGYGKTKGSGSGSMYSNTLSLGLYTTWEKDFSVFGVTLFSAEAEIAINNSMTWETVEMSFLEQSVEYESLSGQDTVVFFSVPVETYVYEARTPVIVNGLPTGEYETQTMTVNIPHEANVKNLPVETYNRIAADYDGLPNIDGSVLSHRLGEPFSYPKTTAGFGSNTKSLPKLVSSGNASSVGFGASSQSKEIAMTQETEKSFTYDLEIDTKFGVGGGGIKAGITAGYGHGAGSINITTSGNSFSSTMQALPKEAEPYGYNFNWKLFAYPYANGGNIFPVVTYLLSDVVEPPLLPINFEQIEDGSGDTEIALTWQHSGNPQSFVVYRYFQSTSAAGYYPVTRINAGDIANIIKTEGNTRTYQYIDINLSPNTEYKYRIQTIGNGMPDTSIQSATIIAYTAPSGVNMPIVTLDKESLMVYPDTPSTVTAIVENMASGGTINFMWQKENKDGTWKDLGVNSDTLRIIDAGLDDAGLYRCKVAVFMGQNLVSAYSPKLVVEYQKREVELSDFKVDGSIVSVIAKGKDTQSIPSGVITFTLSTAGYTKEYSATLNTAGKAETSLAAVNGIYKVSAAYGGNRIFRTSAIDKDNNKEPVFFTAGTHSGVLYDYGKTYTYGDDLNITKYIFTEDSKVSLELVDYSQLDATRVSIQLFKPTKTSIEGEDNVFQIDINEKVEYTLTDGNNPAPKTLEEIRGGYIGLDEDTLLERFKDGKAGWVGDVLLNIDDQDIFFHVNPAPITIVFKQGDSNYSVPDILSKNELIVSIDGKGRLYDFTPAKSLEVIGQTKFNDDLLPSADSSPLSSDYYGLRIKLHDSINKYVTGWRWWPSGVWRPNDSYNILAPGLYTVSIGMFTHTGESQVIPWLCYDINSESKTLLITGDAYVVSCMAANENSTGNTVGKVELVKPIDVRNMYPVGTELVFLATPYDGYVIDEWRVNNIPVTNNPTNRLTLTQTAAGSIVTVSFKVKENTLTYSALPENPTVAGESVKNIITGSVKSGNVITAGAPMSFTAQAATGWHFVSWESFIEGGQTQYGSNISYTMTMPNSSVRLFAKFERDSYQVTLGQGLTAIDESGNILDTSKPIKGDTEITVKPMAGMVVESGAVWTVDDVETALTGTDEYTFTLKKDTKVTLPVSVGTYKVNATVDNDEYGRISIDVLGVTNPDLNNIEGGSSIRVTAMAKRGYILDKWIIDGITVSKNSSYTFTLANDTEVRAVFVERMDFHNLEVNKGLYDEIDVTVNDYELKTDISEKIYPGEYVTITAKPKSGYMVNGWYRNAVFSQIYSNTLIVSYDELFSELTRISPQFVAISTGKLNYRIESVKTDNEYKARLTVKDASGRTIEDNGNMVNQSGLTFTASFETQSGMNIVTSPSGITSRLVSKWTITYAGEDEEVVLNEAGEPFMANALNIPGLAGSAIVKAYYESRHELEACEVITNGGISGIGISIAEPVLIRSEASSGEIIYKMKPNFAIKGTAVTFTVAKTDSLGAVKLDGSGGRELIIDGVTFTGFDRIEKVNKGYICTVWAIPGHVSISTIDKSTEPPEETKSSQTIIFTDSIQTKTYGDGPFTMKAMLQGMGGTGKITYASNNESVAMVDSTTGEVTIVGVGLATITATKEEDANYTKATASYNLIVANIVTYTITASTGANGTITPVGRVAVTKGSSQTFTITANSGYSISSVTVDGVNHGSINSYTFSNVTDNHTIAASFISNTSDTGDGGTGGGGGNGGSSPGGSITPPIIPTIPTSPEKKLAPSVVAPYAPMNMTDTASHWGKDAIDYVLSRGLFAGTSDTTFSPDAPMTRAMVWTVLARLDGQATSGGRSWYSASQTWVMDNGISDGTLPQGNVTREQLISILYRYTGSPAINRDQGSFADAGLVSGWASPAMQWAVENGLIRGSNNKLNPQYDITRAEVAAILMRYIQLTRI